jgi:hypothetical protein
MKVTTVLMVLVLVVASVFAAPNDPLNCPFNQKCLTRQCKPGFISTTPRDARGCRTACDECTPVIRASARALSDSIHSITESIHSLIGRQRKPPTAAVGIQSDLGRCDMACERCQRNCSFLPLGKAEICQQACTH